MSLTANDEEKKVMPHTPSSVFDKVLRRPSEATTSDHSSITDVAGDCKEGAFDQSTSIKLDQDQTILQATLEEEEDSSYPMADRGIKAWRYVVSVLPLFLPLLDNLFHLSDVTLIDSPCNV